MSRLDELLALRKQIDAEIEREHAAIIRARSLSRRSVHVLSRGSWNTRAFVAACDHFGVTGDEVLSSSRVRNVVNARHVAMWLMRDAGRTLTSIGTELGCDHTSVLNAIRRVDRTPDLLAAAVEIRALLTGEGAA